MSWDSLVAFVQAEAPSFVASFAGVSPEAIARVEADYRLRLPDNYRRFLLLMGEDSAGFHLFGPGQNQRFADLVEQLPDEPHPAQYFKIAGAADDSIVTRLDHFLDLARSDGVDAPIVMFGSEDEISPGNALEKGFTFLEQAYRRLFAHLADERVPERLLVAIPYGSGEQGPSSVGAIGTVLERMRFALAFESLPRVACLRREHLWALVASHLGGQGFAVSLWSTERSALEAASDQLLIRFPNATVQNRGRLHAL